MKVTIVGAGIMGLSAAWALHRQGYRVTVYEQGTIPNPLASSVDQHRLIRFPYGRELGYTRMVVDAYRAWEILWQDLGKSLYAQTGTLVLSSVGESWTRGSAETLRAIGVSVRWLATEEFTAKFPLLNCQAVESAFYLDSGGVLLAEQIIGAIANYLISRKVMLHAQAGVESVDLDRARVVLSDRTVVDADVLVISAGAWVSRLLPSMSQRVTPSRQVVVYVEPPADKIEQWSRAPMILDIHPECGFYLVPPVLGTEMKVGDHRFTLTGDPERDRVAGEAEAQIIYQQLETRLVEFSRYRWKHARTCFYTVAPQERFIVEPIGNSWLMTGFSGHGFKFGAIVGLAIAEAIAGHQAPAAIGQWASGINVRG